MVPCRECSIALWQAGIETIKYGKKQKTKIMEKGDEGIVEFIQDNTNLTITFVDPEFKKVKELWGEYVDKN